MKKLINLIILLSLLMTIFLAGNVYAAALDTIKIDVNKTTVRPGEEVKLTITFGQQLGAYTFDINYDNNIFEYISVDGGTANDTTDKVKVTFHDVTGGTNPRENMSIIFKAKEDITTSNPTELTVTGEGLANADASVTYDDITIPMVKNLTVEPEYQPYEINLEYTGNIIKEEEKEMKLAYSSSMGKYYEHARLIAEAKTPDGENVKLIGKDASTQADTDIIQHGWGEPQGYKIGGKDVKQILNLKAIFSGAGKYTITFKLIDRDNSDNVIAEKAYQFDVTEKQTTPVPPQNEQKPPQTEQTPPPIEQTPPPTETNPETTPDKEIQTENKPTTLPKTGYNIYVPIIAIIIFLSLIIVYYNRKNLIK